MTREDALKKVESYLASYLPIDNYAEVEEILKALKRKPRNDNTISKYYWKGFYDGMRAAKLKGNKQQEPCDLQWSD